MQLRNRPLQRTRNLTLIYILIFKYSKRPNFRKFAPSFEKCAKSVYLLYVKGVCAKIGTLKVFWN